ncbi:MAG: putative phosphoserine phosphatase / 1-acylglycerol-3-phosphate O-acyltransferase, partial [Actinomycetota bacterium]|nr:putative phosphoserine phosphatase / 1-acylglycerol-3-phosphate O-acyltransferase [Actinomycetota bacterium]
MPDVAYTLGQIRSGPTGPAIGAFFDFDGTIIEGFSALAFYQHRLRNFEIGPEEATRTMLATVRGPMDEA